MRAASLVLVAPMVVWAPLALSADNETKVRLNKSFNEAKELDWVPIEQLTEEQKKRVPVACCGAYLPPVRTDADAEKMPETAPFHGYAEEESVEAQNRLTFTGNVSITQGNRSLRADSAEFDKAKSEAKLTGSIQVRDPKVMIRADAASLNTDTGNGDFDNTRFVIYEARIHGVADHIQRFGDNIINLEQTELSSCEPGDNAWSIHGSEVSLHTDEHFGYAKNMLVTVNDFPVIYMPYGRFPLGSERLTGFLFPMMTYSGRNGAELSTPFYWNIAPEFDATFTPRYMTHRGPMLETDFRHLAQHFETEVSGSFINNDHGGYSSYLEEQIKNGTKTEEEAYPYRGHNRWNAHLQQKGGRGEAWSSYIDYSDLSDKDYLRDMYSGAVDSNRLAFIRQVASLDYRTDHWYVGAKSDEYRLLTNAHMPFRELPRVHVDGNYQLDDWTFTLNNEYVKFVENRYFASSYSAEEIANDELGKARASTVFGERASANYSALMENSFSWGFIRPSVGVRSLAYQLDTKNLSDTANDSPSFLVPQASVDSGMYFERATDLFGGEYLQTLEPRAFYFYSAYKDQSSLYKLTRPYGTQPLGFVNFDTSDLTFNYNQLFRTTRFAGGDRIDDANQLSLAVSTAFITEDTGLERLRVSVGQIFYARDRHVLASDKDTTDKDILAEATRRTSDVAVQASGQIGAGLRMSADAAYDQRSGQLDNANVGLHYIDDSSRIFNFTYRYALKPAYATAIQSAQLAVSSLDQIDISMMIPVNASWSLIARGNHDLKYGKELDTFAGFEYNDCCTRVAFLARHSLRVDYTTPNFLENASGKDYEPSVLMDFELKGLGGLLKQASSLLDEAINGFNSRGKIYAK